MTSPGAGDVNPLDRVDMHRQLDEIIEKLEQFAWMVSAESRTPAGR